MGQHKSDPQLFNYAVNLEKRVRAAHPLRRVKATIDFGFVREEASEIRGQSLLSTHSKSVNRRYPTADVRKVGIKK